MRKFTPLVFVLLAMLNACTRDRIDIDPDKAPGTDLSGDARYFGISLGMAGGVGTKADYDYEDGDNGFVYGTASEYAVRNLMILFFDDNGNQVFHVTSSEQTTEDGENDIEKKFERLITIPLGETDEDIEETKEALASVTSFITILNYDPDWDKDGSDLYKATLNKSAATDIDKFHSGFRYTIDDSNGFVMSTAGHYDANGKFVYYDTCDAGTIFYETSSAALKNPVTVTVERLAARVDIELKKNIEPIEVLYGTDVYGLYFEPDRWGMEAEEKDGFISKNQKEKSHYGTGNNYPAGYGDWADYMSHRTFWAESPTFTGGKYAWKGTENVDGTSGSLSLAYTTFGDLSRFQDPNADPNTASCYTSEHTFAASELNSSSAAFNPYGVPSSIVVGGKYTVKYLTSDERTPDEKPILSQEPGTEMNLNGAGFYIRYVDLERTDKPSDPSKRYSYRLYREQNDNGKDDLYEAYLKEQYAVFFQTEDGSYVPVKASTETDSGENLAQKIFELANTYCNKFTLQLKSDIDFNALPSLFYGADGVYEPLNESNRAAANASLLKQLGYSQLYWQGHAFFYAPIPHYTGEGSPFLSEYTGLFNYSKYSDGRYVKNDAGNYVVDHRNGEFGIVRNHIYQITIDKISTLGQGIPSEDTIPLPEPRPDHEIWQFDMTLKVLPWNQFKYTFDI